MTIPRGIPSRLVEAIADFVTADPDFGPLVDDGAKIYLAPYDEMGLPSVPMAPSPRQMHIYEGAGIKGQGVSGVSVVDIEIVIEYYSPRNELPRIAGQVSVDDELRELGNRLVVGQSTSPGRFRDPDNAALWLNNDLTSRRISMLRVAADESAMRRVMVLTFKTKENAAGVRVHG